MNQDQLPNMTNSWLLMLSGLIEDMHIYSNVIWASSPASRSRRNLRWSSSLISQSPLSSISTAFLTPVLPSRPPRAPSHRTILQYSITASTRSTTATKQTQLPPSQSHFLHVDDFSAEQFGSILQSALLALLGNFISMVMTFLRSGYLFVCLIVCLRDPQHEHVYVSKTQC